MLVKSLEDDELFALKRIPCDDLASLNLALKEAQAVLQLRHPYVVKCYEFFVERDESDLHLVSNEQVAIVYVLCFYK